MSKYILVSLPSSISTNDKDALESLRSTVAANDVSVQQFKIPDFKIGTLDALVQQADELAKLESSCEAVVAKVGDALRSLLEGDESKIAQQKTVNDSVLVPWIGIQYRLLTSFQKQSLQISTYEPSHGTRSNIVPISRLQS